MKLHYGVSCLVEYFQVNADRMKIINFSSYQILTLLYITFSKWYKNLKMHEIMKIQLYHNVVVMY